MRSGVFRSYIFFFTRVDFYAVFFFNYFGILCDSMWVVSFLLELDFCKDVFFDLLADLGSDLFRLLLTDFLDFGVGYRSLCIFKFLQDKGF